MKKKIYNQRISRTTINLILRNQLGLKFLKTSDKNNMLLSTKIKEQTFFEIKIIIRHLKLGGKILFINESTLYAKNVNYKTWRKSSNQVFNNFKAIINLI